MPVSISVEGPDSEELNSVFSRDEWGYEQRIMLDAAFSSLAAVLGSEDDPIESIAVSRLLAVVFAVGWSSRMLSAVNPVDFAGHLESAIEARGGLLDIGPAADANLATAQGVATDQIQLDSVGLYVSMYGTIDPFAVHVTALPVVEDAHVNCSAFPRLAKLATRDGNVPEGKLRSLAARFRVELPLSTDLTDAAKVKWVWGLASLSQSITVRATGWLRLATTTEEFEASVLELSDDGRFTAEWMTERRQRRTASAEQERTRRELGAGFDATLTALGVWAHVSSAVLATGDTEDRSLACDAARSLRKFHDLELEGAGLNVMKMAAGTAVLLAMKRKGHGTDRLGVAPSGTAEALQYIVTYVVPTPTPLYDGGEPAAGAAAAAAGAGSQTVQLSAASMEALQAAAGRSASGGAAREPSEKITLGKAPSVAHELRPEWFSPKDVEPFERHEEAFKRLSLLKGEAFKEAWVELDPEARCLASVPVYAQDLARCPRLLALDLVYGRLAEVADSILIKGTSLAGDRESPEQRSEDRDRRANLATLQKGNVVEAGPQICVVQYRLASFWVFAMVPYQSGTVASSVNGVWDEAWRTWAKVAEFSLGVECEIVPAVEMILKVVRKTSISGHHQWPEQARCDYPGVAMWFFARDYRAYREGRVDEKPSLLQIFQSTDYLIYFKMQMEYAVNVAVRPKIMPYCALVIGAQLPKRARPAFDVADLADEGALADDESTPKKPTKKKKKPKATAELKPPARAPKSEPKTVAHVAGTGAAHKGNGLGDGGFKVRPEGGSAFPDDKFVARNDIDDSLLAIIQAKLDQSNGIDKGACAWCLFAKNGCPRDKRVGLQGSCGRAHMGPADRKPAFCITACKTAGLEGPLYLNNKKFWTTSLSGHTAAEAKPKAKAAGATKGTPVPSEAEDDDDDEDP